MTSSQSNVPRPTSRRDRFQTLYEAHYHRVLGYALRRANNEDAADVVAETFLVAWRRLDAVPDGEAARLWLYGTARRVLANQERAKRRRERLSERIRSEPAPEPVPVEPALAAATALARLRGDERELLRLVAWEGLDAGEIAEVWGCSRNAARIRIHRARRRFARELARLAAVAEANPGRPVGTLVETEEPL